MFLDVLFGALQKYKNERRELLALWQRARGEFLLDEEEESGGDVGWSISQSKRMTRLVDVRLHQPRPANEQPNALYVHATLQFSAAEERWQERQVTIGLSEVLLSFDTKGYQPAQGTMIGDSNGRKEHENFKWVVGGVESYTQQV